MNTKNVYRLDVSSFVDSVITPSKMSSTPAKKYTADELEAYRRFAAKAASELRYGWDVIKLIRDAKSEAEITRILADARHKQS